MWLMFLVSMRGQKSDESKFVTNWVKVIDTISFIQKYLSNSL